ncbi:MAG: helicase HerA domain-containing protein, partial [Zestosphaera sp.]
MAVSIGHTYAWRDGITYVIISSNDYRPGIGDILYVKIESGYVLLQVSGSEGEIPVSPTSFLAREGYTQYAYVVEKTTLAKTIPIFEIRDVRSGNDVRSVVMKPSQPPPLDIPVYILKGGDVESEHIMSLLSRKIPKKEDNAVPIAWLRAGIASVKELMPEKYFRNACLRLNLEDMIPKHVLISGQTGSGKTTSVMGIITQWIRHGGKPKPISWIIADRHGEYSETEKFVGVLSKALKLNSELRDSYGGIYIYTLKTNIDGVNRRMEEYPVTRLEGGFDAASVNVYDVINAAGLLGRDVSELLEITSILTTLIKNASEVQSSQHSESASTKRLQRTEEHKISESVVRVFIDKNEDPTGNLLALVPLITSNVVRYEGVREREKKGVYNVFVNAGIYVNTLRDFRRMILSVFGWRERTENLVFNGRKIPVSVIDDRNSVFKVTPILKDPQLLITLLKA